jgi:hypothetical protein
MRMRPLLMALAVFTLVNGAITLYLVRTMYASPEGAEQQEAQGGGDLRRAPMIAGAAALHEESESPTRGVLAQRAVVANEALFLDEQQEGPDEDQPFPTAGPRRWRVRCISYKKETKMRRSARGLGECYGDRGTPYAERAFRSYFEMTTGDDWDLLWALVPAHCRPPHAQCR